MLLERSLAGRNPFDFTRHQEAAQVIEKLSSLDRDAWAEVFSRPMAGREALALRTAYRGGGETCGSKGSCGCGRRVARVVSAVSGGPDHY